MEQTERELMGPFYVGHCTFTWKAMGLPLAVNLHLR